MKKKVIMALTATLLSLSMSVSAFAGTLSVNFNGVNRVFNNATKINGTTFVDAEKLSDIIYTNIDYNEFTGAIKINNGTTDLVMKLNSTTGLLNDEPVTLPEAPKMTEKGVLILPLRFIAESFGYEVSYDSSKGLITVLNDSPYITNLGGLNDVTDETKVYTYQEAVDTAIKNSSTLKNAVISLDATNAQLSSLNDTIDQNSTFNYYDPTTGNRVVVENPAIKSAFISRDTLADAIALQEDSLEVTKTGVELALIGNLIALDAYNSNYQILKETLGLQETNLNNTILKHSLGLVSETDVKKAQTEYDNTKVSLDKLATSIETAKQNLNATLGVPLSSDTYVQYATTITDEHFDVEKLVQQALKESMAIKAARNNVEAAERGFKYITTTENYHELNRNLDSANIKLADQKISTEKAVRSAYVEYQNTINNQKTLEAAKETAINNYNNGIVSYEAGYITEYELQALNTAIMKAEADLLSNELSYKLISFRLHHPELF